jgi:hypothetical protein
MEETQMSEPKQNDLLALYRATDKANPKPEDIKAMRDYFVKYPVQAALIGDLAIEVEGRIRGNAFKNSQAADLAADQYMYDMRKALGFDTCPAIERPLIQHVVLCWLRLHICELHYERHTKGATLTVATFWENTLSANQRRYLRAVETLARIRKLNLTIQVNVAHQQIVTG